MYTNFTRSQVHNHIQYMWKTNCVKFENKKIVNPMTNICKTSNIWKKCFNNWRTINIWKYFCNWKILIFENVLIVEKILLVENVPMVEKKTNSWNVSMVEENQ
jgi:hypothetical protein